MESSISIETRNTRSRSRLAGGRHGLCIVGFGESRLPWESEEYDETWAINEVVRITPGLKPDIIVAMDDWERDNRIDPDYVSFISGLNVPVVSSAAYPKWPCLTAYPLKAVIAFIGYDRCFDNSICYAFALALFLRKFGEITLLGCDFWTKDDGKAIRAAKKAVGKRYGAVPEWFKYYQPVITRGRRLTEPGGDSLSLLIGLSAAHQIKVFIPKGTRLLNLDRDRYFYGYTKQPELR